MEVSCSALIHVSHIPSLNALLSHALVLTVPFPCFSPHSFHPGQSSPSAHVHFPHPQSPHLMPWPCSHVWHPGPCHVSHAGSHPCPSPLSLTTHSSLPIHHICPVPIVFHPV